MMSSLDVATPEQVNELKIQVKKWERKFENENGRKPNKDDIDNDDEIKERYIIYWKMIKILKKQEAGKLINLILIIKFNSLFNTHTENKNKQNQQPTDTWNDSCKKKVNQKIDEFKSGFVCKNKTINSISNRLFKNELQNKPSRLSYSLNRKDKTRTDDDGKCIRINSNQVCLLKRQSSEIVTDNFVNLITRQDQMDCVNYSEPKYTETTTTLDLHGKQIEIEDFTNLDHPSNSLFVNLHDRPSNQIDKQNDFHVDNLPDRPYNQIDKQNDFHVDNLPDVYDFSYQPDPQPSTSKTTDETKKKKLDVKELTKQKSKRKRSAYKDLNFKRIDIKKKTYSRGHKRININKYKKDQWKKLQRENKCFKCGEKDHWANECPNIDQELKEIENENYDELEEMVSDEVITNSTQPLFSDDDRYNMQIEINKALNDFGFQSFRSNQQEVIERILLGKSCLMISSTGSGKSLCYQLPAYIYYKFKKYITVVVSPLISLMEDQMLCLPKCLKAVCLHSGLSETVKKANLNKIQSGEVQVLFLSPEYILAHLVELSLLPTIGFVCIDEAHCLSEWSNNFRPSYLQFFNVLREKMKINTFLALTATANVTTTKQILKNIGMSFESDVIGVTKIPNNLVLTISRDLDKDFALISLLKSERFFNLNSIIIYCSRRETTEKIATLIRIEMQKSKDSTIDQEWNACAYHAGLSYQDRKRIQKNFISGKLRVVVATIAFGMGINKSDVDGVIHFSLPKTIENYIQEIGRAGRNGKSAQCHIFLDHDSSDLFEQQRHIYSNGIDKINVKKLTSKLFKPCKCLKLRQIAEEAHNSSDNQMSIDQNYNEQKSNRCPGHENAFSIKELTEELDIKEETLLTILIYLELNLKNIKINVMNKTFSICVLSCYKGGSEQMNSLAKKHPFIALPLAQLKKENPNLEDQTILKFSYINVASMLGQPSREVFKKLKALEWKYEQGRRLKSNIRIAFEEPSIHVITPGDLDEQEIENITRMILNYSKSQEILEVKRLKQFYETLKESSQSKCINKINNSKSLKLKKVLNDYFDLSRTQSNLPEEDDLDNIDNLEKISNQTVLLKDSNNSE